MAGMKSVGKNHPWKRIFVGRDEIRGENHLWERILIRRDEIREEESSLEEDFCWQG